MNERKIMVYAYKGALGRTLRVDIWNEEDFLYFQQLLLRLKTSEKEMYSCKEDARFYMYNLENFCIARYKGDKHIGVNSRRDEDGHTTITWFVNDDMLNALFQMLQGLQAEPGSRQANKPGEYALIEIGYKEYVG